MPFYSMDDAQSINIAEPVIGPCPVCGTAGGNCQGESSYHGTMTIIPKKERDPRATFRVPRRVYEEKTVDGKTVKKLLYPKGAAITQQEAQRLGFLPNEGRFHIS